MKLSVLILSYNTSALTLNCLDSVFQEKDSASWEVIVVDNASSDDSVSQIAKHFPQVTIIRSQSNKGFAGGNNLGLKVARGEYIILLNSDTLIVPGALTTLINFLDNHPSVGAVTPKVILPDGAIDLACHRGMPTPWNAFTYFSKLESLFPRFRPFSGYHQTYQDFSQSHQIGASAATALMVRRDLFTTVGLLDERYFMYGEDLDFCQRLTDAQWEIWYCPEAEVKHLKSASGKKNRLDSQTRSQSIEAFYTTMKQFYEKHYQKKYPKWLRQLVYLGIDIKQWLHRS